MTDWGSFTAMLFSLHPSLFSWWRKAVTPPPVLLSCILPLPSTALLIFPDWCLLPAISMSFHLSVFSSSSTVGKKCQQEKASQRGSGALRYANIMLMVLCEQLNCCQLKAIRNSSVWHFGCRWRGLIQQFHSSAVYCICICALKSLIILPLWVSHLSAAG